VTEAGACTVDGAELVTLIVNPPAGAGWLNQATRDVIEPPCTTEFTAQSHCIDGRLGAGAVTVKATDSVRLPPVSEIVSGVSDVTWLVETVNDPVDAPADTDTEGGTVAEGLDEETRTVTPPAGAAPSNVKLTVAAPPPATVAALMDAEARLG